MGFFNFLKPPPVEDIRTLKLKFLELPEKYTRQITIVGYGASRGIEIIETICAVCDDVIKALEKGIGVEGAPINKQQISNGLKRLVADARTDLGIVAMHLSPDGVQLYQQYLKQLEDIANKIG
jgi:type IV secretory pathway protease TraF